MLTTPPFPDPPPEATVPATIVPTFVMVIDGRRFRCYYTSPRQIVCYKKLPQRKPWWKLLRKSQGGK